MIDNVANQLAAQLATLPFISLAGGIARPQKIKTENVSRTLPAVPKNDGTAGYNWLTPDSKQVGIAYFENISNELDDKLGGGRGQMYKAVLRVVVWLNLNRITPADTGAMQSQVVALLSSHLPNTDFISNVRVIPIREVPRSADIFSKYTYNEVETQHLMLPYDYFAWDFDVRYVLNSACHKTQFIQKDPSC